jgi:hypothetical protein
VISLVEKELLKQTPREHRVFHFRERFGVWVPAFADERSDLLYKVLCNRFEPLVREL